MFIELIADALALINKDMDEQEKIYTVMQYIADRFSYYLIWKKTTRYSLSEVLEKGHAAICQHYAWVGSLILNILGIQAYSKPSHNNHHQFIIVKTKTPKDNEPKWYYLDPTFFDSGDDNNLKSDHDINKPFVKFLPSGLLQDYTTGNKDYSFFRGYLLKMQRNESEAAETYAGWQFMRGNSLPMNHIVNEDNMADEDYLDFTMLNDRRFKLLSNNSLGHVIRKKSRYFKYGDNWYFFGSYKYKDSGKVGLFKSKFHNTTSRFDLIANKEKIYDNEDPIAKLFANKLDLFDIKSFNGVPKVFMQGNYTYVYQYRQEKENKHNLFAIDLLSASIIDLNLYFNEKIIEKDKEYDLYTFGNKLYIRDAEIDFKQLNIEIDKNVFEIKLKDIPTLNLIRTKYDVYKEALIARLEVGTYMFEDVNIEGKNLNNIKYVPVKLRNVFNKKYNEFISLYEITNSDINSLKNKLNELKVALDKISKY